MKPRRVALHSNLQKSFHVIFFSLSVSSSSDVALSCDSDIPLVAQELMRNMIRQFALEYASKCLPYTSTNGVTTRTSSPVSETSDAPLDLTVSRTQEDEESKSEPGTTSIKHVLNLKPIHKKIKSRKVIPNQCNSKPNQFKWIVLLPDGVLDLSNRNSACSAASSTFSSNHKASG